MNIYAVAIIIFLLIDTLLGLVADILNMGNISEKLPAEFEDIWDQKRYTTSQQYLKTTTKVGLVSGAVHLAAFVLFWFLGGFGFVDRFTRSLELPDVLCGVLFIGILVVANSLLGLGFSIYSTFVVEERFGMNKTTVRTFITDRIKMLFLGTLIGGPVLAGIIFFFDRAGALAWLYCWLGVSGFLLLIQLVAPVWIMPLFNKFVPMEDGELKGAVTSFARKVQYPLDNIFVTDGSRRSARSNAYFMGFGKKKRIALFDTLVAQHTVPEIVAVVAHEIGHYKKHHVITGMAIAILHTGVMFFLLNIFLSHQGLFDAFYVKTPSVWAGLVFFSLLFTPVETLLGIFLNAYSRKNEYEADHFAATNTKDPEAMVSALKKLSRDNLSNLTPHPLFVRLHYSHPPILERIFALRKAGR